MNKLLPILCFLIIASCSKEIPFDQLVERNGIYYEVNSQTPCSGRTVNYYENGQLLHKENWKDGELDRLYEYYFENGQLMLKGNYKDGKEEGLSESYYENGQLLHKENWKDGNADGLFESYYENGQLESRECWQNNEKVDMSNCGK
jgi:antitoxin component YwqK of YwqJK toxin-antitoxin module